MFGCRDSLLTLGSLVVLLCWLYFVFCWLVTVSGEWRILWGNGAMVVVCFDLWWLALVSGGVGSG